MAEPLLTPKFEVQSAKLGKRKKARSFSTNQGRIRLSEIRSNLHLNPRKPRQLKLKSPPHSVDGISSRFYWASGLLLLLLEISLVWGISLSFPPCLLGIWLVCSLTQRIGRCFRMDLWGFSLYPMSCAEKDRRLSEIMRTIGSVWRTTGLSF